MMVTAGVTTVVVALLVGLLLIVGAVVIGWSASSGAASQACPKCGQMNVEAARFCGRCGTPLR